ncbi:hypothetical protein HY468_03435 [Candidatus Roizmanbacteria bacterium]|nr:hypothetical protein [Candidatus Roizmanbacteria bacterium]
MNSSLRKLVEEKLRDIVFPQSTEVDVYALTVLGITGLSAALFDFISQNSIELTSNTLLPLLVFILPLLLDTRSLIMLGGFSSRYT